MVHLRKLSTPDVNSPFFFGDLKRPVSSLSWCRAWYTAFCWS
jgi:hypothetical protein